jgi:hypothetical protein
MNSRERVALALNHQEPDRVPLDLGAGFQTGMHVQTVYKLRQALGLDEPGTPVKIIEPYQSLGEIKMDLIEEVGADVVGVNPLKNMFGFKNENWVEWTAFDGTPVLVPEKYNTVPEENGKIYMYPEGDQSVPPSGVMPKDGWYFDAVVRQPPFEEDELNVEDNLEEFGPISEEELDHFETEIKRLYEETDKAIYANFGGTAFGDIALVPAPWLKHPKGIRDITEWYISTVSREEYVYQIFERQCEIALENLKNIYDVVGNRVQVVFLTGTDFAAQDRPFMSVDTYRKLFMPFHARLNDWIHENTTWKTFMHTDGSITPLLPSFVEAGFDVMNPIQWTAKDMHPPTLKAEYGDDLVFWGGGVDTQKTLPFGTPEEVRAEVIQRLKDFAPGGGYVFNSVHNVQPMVPVENVLAMYEAFHEHAAYPVG